MGPALRQPAWIFCTIGMMTLIIARLIFAPIAS